MKKNKRVIALMMVVLLFCSTFMTDITVMAEEYNEKTENQITEANGTNAESQASENIDIKNDSSKKECIEESTEDNNVDSSESQTKVAEEESQGNLQTEQEVQKKDNKLNYLYINEAEQDVGTEQDILISWGAEDEDVEQLILELENAVGEQINLSSSNKIENAYLFQKTLKKGIYHVKGLRVISSDNDVTYTAEELNVNAYFGVGETYTGDDKSNYMEMESVAQSENEVAVQSEEAVENSASVVVLDENGNADNVDSIADAMEEVGVEKQSQNNSRARSVARTSNVVVVLDPGHDAGHTGARGNGVKEEVATLKIAQACKEELEQYSGVTVYMTRETAACPYPETVGADSGNILDIKKRTAWAKTKGADVFISFHLNSADATGANGAEVYYPAKSGEGKVLAQDILNKLLALGLHDRKVKGNESYAVVNSSMANGFPGLIIEHAFVSNSSDASKYLNSDAKLKKLGVADATGIAEYFGLTKGPDISIKNKNDFKDTADIIVKGGGKSANVAIWNENSSTKKWYTLDCGSGTITFKKSDFGNATGKYYVELYNSDKTKKLYDTSFRVSSSTSVKLSSESESDKEITYKLNATFADMPDEVSEVTFPVWTTSNQSDIKWISAKQEKKGQWVAEVNISDYKKTGEYNVHAYAVLQDGTQQFLGTLNFSVSDTDMSVSIENYQKDKGTFDVIIKNIKSASGVQKIQVPVWCADGQKDLIWHTASKQNDGSYKATISVADHNYLTGEYNIHVYFTANNGVLKTFVAPKLSVSKPNMELTGKDTSGKELTYSINITNVGLVDYMMGVEFAVWSEKNGQDDLVWYTGKKVNTDCYTATVDIAKNHKTSGEYHLHAYGITSNGKKKFIGETTFKVTEPSMSVSVENYQKDKGTFDVVIKDIKTPAGVSQIQVPVWCADGQKDLIWHTALKQSDGSYKVTVNMADHDYLVGDYNIHVYLQTQNGVLKTYVAPTLNVTLPNVDISAVDMGKTETNYALQVTNVGILKNVKRVQFAVWSEKNGQDDLVWYEGSKGKSGQWTATADITKNHKTSGKYQVHVYAVTADDSSHFLGRTTFEVTEPSMSVSVENYQKDKGTFDVVIKDIKTPAGVSQVQVPVWAADGQKDLIWHTAIKQNDGSYKTTINIADHNNLIGNYNIHVYLRTKNGVLKTYVTDGINVLMPNADISITDTDKTETAYDLKITGTGTVKNVTRVRFAVWSEKNGQDDLVWYEGKKNQEGQWTTVADIAKNHRTFGEYQVHVYAVTSDGNEHFLGKDTFNVTEPQMTVSVENYQKEKGQFDVVIRDIKAPAGVNQVQVPVWCADGQKDLVWHTATKQSDGSYKAIIDIANHDYLIGYYNIHVYLRTKNGLLKTYVTDGLNVSMPDAKISIEDKDKTETNYELKIANPEIIKNVKKVQFAVWSEKNGQDDLIWYDGSEKQKSIWTAMVDIMKHKTAGGYQVHAYAVTSDGNSYFLGKTTFKVTEPQMEVEVTNYQAEEGQFDVIIKNVESKSGVKQIRVPVWCADNQSDIYWYTAVKQDDGSYKAVISTSNHKNAVGDYKIHVYLTAGNDVQKVMIAPSQPVITAGYYTIMGQSTVTVDQLVKYYEKSGNTYPGTELAKGGAALLEQFCQIYYEEAQAEGVRVEVAFTQAMKETGWLRYGGIVKIEQFNFAGLGALDGNATGNCASFRDVREGVRAQIQHLKAYGSKESLKNACVDPRFKLVKRGAAPYVEWLGIQENPSGVGWATSKNYGSDIVNMIKRLKTI